MSDKDTDLGVECAEPPTAYEPPLVSDRGPAVRRVLALFASDPGVGDRQPPEEPEPR